MKFNDINERLENYDREHTHAYYEYVLNNALLNLQYFVDNEEAELAEKDYDILFNLFNDYYDDSDALSPWQVADSIVKACNEIGLEKFVELSYHEQLELIEDKLMEF